MNFIVLIKPTAPIRWQIATKDPAATPPPFAMAADDIKPAAIDFDIIPAAVKPIHLIIKTTNEGTKPISGKAPIVFFLMKS